MNTILHFIGAVFFLMGAIGVAFNKVEQYEKRYQLIYESERILKLCRQKILYQKMPVEDIVEELSEDAGYQWKKLLWKIKREQETKKLDFPKVFEICMKGVAMQMGMTKQEEQFLLEIPQVFWAFDQTEVEMELNMLMEEQKMIVEELDKNRKDVKKVTMAFGIAGGVMGILLLI